MSIELEPLVLESTLTMQKILEAKDHSERVQLLRFFIDAERKRLEARKVLQGMFKGETKQDETMDVTEADVLSSIDEFDDSGGASSFFSDEPDAFQ